MNSAGRVKAAFEKKATDKVPVCHISFSHDTSSKLLGRDAYVGYGIQQWREATALWNGDGAHAEFIERMYSDLIDINRVAENDIWRFAYARCNVKPTRRIDEHTFLYEYGDEGQWKVLRYDPQFEHQNVVFDYKPRPEPGLDDLERAVAAKEKALETYDPQPEDLPYMELTLRAQKEFGHEIPMRAAGMGIGIPGNEAWLAASVVKPDLVGRYLDAMAEEGCRRIKLLASLGFRYMFGGGDFAGYQGPFYSPKVFHDLVLPRLQRLCDACHEVGAYYLFASDGDLWPVADDLFGASGVDGFYEIDSRAGMDLRRLRETFPALTLIGNMSCHLLHRGTRKEVVEQTLGCIEEAKRSKGILVGVTNMIVPGSPIENVRAMLDTIRDNR